MNEAALRGIDLTALENERPTSTLQVEEMRRHDERAQRFWEWKKGIVVESEEDDGLSFTRAQFAIALEAFGGSV